MTRFRIGLTAALLAALALVGVFGWRRSNPSPPDAASAIGGAFSLVDQRGAPVSQARLLGKWSAVFFGYTYCPDVCPTTLVNLGQAVGGMGAQAARFQVVFITIDPQRDTPGALRTYLASPAFPPATIGLTGTPAQIDVAARAYHVYYQKVPQGTSYSMDHSSVVYLMDPKGRFVRPLDVNVPPAAVRAQILTAIAGG